MNFKLIKGKCTNIVCSLSTKGWKLAIFLLDFLRTDLFWGKRNIFKKKICIAYLIKTKELTTSSSSLNINILLQDDRKPSYPWLPLLTTDHQLHHTVHLHHTVQLRPVYAAQLPALPPARVQQARLTTGIYIYIFRFNLSLWWLWSWEYIKILKNKKWNIDVNGDKKGKWAKPCEKGLFSRRFFKPH